jgi:hypothetical protein
MSGTITPEEIIKSAEKYGAENVLVIDPKEFKNNKNSYDVTWFKSIKFKTPSGNEVKFYNLKFTQVLSASSAKAPIKAGNDYKNLYVCFKNISQSADQFIETAGLTAKKKKTPEKQKKANKEAEEHTKQLIKNTNEFCKALDILNTSYEYNCEKLKTDPEVGGLLNKDNNKVKQIKQSKNFKSLDSEEKLQKLNEDVIINSFKQKVYQDPETDDYVDLDNPIYRIRLLFDKNNGQISSMEWNNDIKKFEFVPNVYDFNKTIKAGDSVLAKVKTDNKKYEPLNKNNAQEFLTIFSIYTGHIKFGQVSCHSKGISWDIAFQTIFVERNKNSVNNNSELSISDLMNLKSKNSDDDEDDEDDEDDDKEVQVGDEDEDDDEEDDDEDDDEDDKDETEENDNTIVSSSDEE